MEERGSRKREEERGEGTGGKDGEGILGLGMTEMTPWDTEKSGKDG